VYKKELLKIDKLTKYYGNFKAVDNVSFTVEKGGIFGLLGENGAGKSTIIKTILGLNPFAGNDLGEITFKGLSVKKHSSEIKRAIGYVPENRVLIEDLTGEEFIDFIFQIYNDKQYSQDEYEYKKDYLFELLKLKERKKNLICNYSNGMKKKILLISAIIHDPEILIIDEPFAALDPESIFIVKKLLTILAQKGCTIMLSSHNLSIIEDLCKDISIMNRGKNIFLGTIEELYKYCGVSTLEEAYIKLIEGSEEVKAVGKLIENIPYPSKNC